MQILIRLVHYKESLIRVCNVCQKKQQLKTPYYENGLLNSKVEGSITEIIKEMTVVSQ